ncbi:unnamed protein product, partial [Sphagnum jensenii]
MLCLPSTNSIKSSVFTRHKELEKAKEKPRNKEKKQSFDVLASTKLAFRSRSLPIRINQPQQERGSSRLRGRETGLSGRCRGGQIVFCCWTTRTTKKNRRIQIAGLRRRFQVHSTISTAARSCRVVGVRPARERSEHAQPQCQSITTGKQII